MFKSQLSVALRGVSMTCAPVDILAIHFDIASEISEPEKPTTAEKTSKRLRSSSVPFCVRTLLDTQDVEHDVDHRENGDVGGDEQDNAFHLVLRSSA